VALIPSLIIPHLIVSHRENDPCCKVFALILGAVLPACPAFATPARTRGTNVSGGDGEFQHMRWRRHEAPGTLSGDMTFAPGMNDAGRWQGVITIRR
jgi:hypothetical protein